MKINGINASYNSPAFGIKVPAKRVLEAACNMFLDDASISNKAQCQLLSQLTGMNSMDLYLGEYALAKKNMAKIIKSKHPELAKSSENIRIQTNYLNRKRALEGADKLSAKEIDDEISHVFEDIVTSELNRLGKSEIDIEPISLKDLGISR